MMYADYYADGECLGTTGDCGEFIDILGEKYDAAFIDASAKYLVEQIGQPALLEQLAEEATELAQMALKLARILRGENPTPAMDRATRSRLIEEWMDVQVAGDVCKAVGLLHDDYHIALRKLARWTSRVRTVKEEQEDEAIET